MAEGNNNRIAKNTVFLSIRIVLLLAISLYTSRIFLEILGIEDYGIVNVVAGFVSMFMFLNTALTNGIQRFYNFELGANGEESLFRVYTTACLIQLLLAVFVVILLESVGLWYMYNKMVIPESRFTPALWLFQFSVVSTVLTILTVPYSAAVITYERMDFYAYVNILDGLLKLCFALLLPYLNPDNILLYGVFFFVTAAINFCLNYLYVKKNFHAFKLKLFFYKDLFLKMISFSGWGFTGSMACMVREQGLNMILNLFFGPIVNAARAIAYQVSSALQGLVQNMYMAASPQMIQSYASGNEDRTLRLMTTMSKINYIFLFVLAVPIVFEIDYILYIWLGNNVPQYSNIFIFWIILTNFVNNLNAPLSNVVYATGQMKKYELTFSILNLSILPVSYLVLKLGAPAVSVFIVYFVLMIVTQVACLIVLQSLVPFSLRDYHIKLIIPLLLSSVSCIIIPSALHYSIENGLLRLFFVTLSNLCISSVVFYQFVFDETEKQYLKNVAQILISKLNKKK